MGGVNAATVVGDFTEQDLLNTVVNNNGASFFKKAGFNAFVETGIFPGGSDGPFTRMEDITPPGFEPGLENDGTGLPDFALAGIVFETREASGVPAVVPVPAAAWLFASAPDVFGYLTKRKANA